MFLKNSFIINSKMKLIFIGSHKTRFNEIDFQIFNAWSRLEFEVQLVIMEKCFSNFINMLFSWSLVQILWILCISYITLLKNCVTFEDIHTSYINLLKHQRFFFNRLFISCLPAFKGVTIVYYLALHFYIQIFLWFSNDPCNFFFQNHSFCFQYIILF